MPTTPTAQTGDIALLPTLTGEDVYASVTALASGGFVVAYGSNVSLTDRPYLQFFDADGVMVGTPIELATTGNRYEYVTAVQLTNGDLMVSYWNGSIEQAQRIDSATGALLGPPITLPGTSWGGLQALGNGGFAYLCHWNNSVTILTFFDAAGTEVARVAPFSYQGAMSLLDDGNLFVALTNAASSNITGMIYTPDGVVVGSGFDISQIDSGVSHVSVATLADGRVVVAFKTDNAGLSNDVAYRIMNADGTPSTGQTVVVAAAGRQEAPSVVALNDGGFIIMWYDLTGADGSGEGVLARRYDSAGTLVGDTFVVPEDPTGNQGKGAYQSHSLAQLQDGDVVFVYRTPGAGGFDLEGRIFSVDGNPAGATLGTSSDDVMDGTAGADNFEAGDGADTLNGLDGDDILNGQGGKDFLYGGDGADTLIGGDGGDLLDGGTGDDELRGGTGDDTYVVDAGDTIVENAGEGIDRVRSSVNWGLADDLEHLQLIGTANYANGNALANQIDGNAVDNQLYGFAGNDIVRGMGGRDSLYGDAGDDMVLGGLDDDSLFGGADNDRLYGEDGDDILDGGDGQDILDGGLGTDSLTGGDGADQLLGGGGGDFLTGGAGNDRLDGGEGPDEAYGGSGDDIYIVDSDNDTVSEAANEGTDTVRASVSWILGANVERLVLEGTGDFEGNGNEGDNQITGNGGANILYGNGGKDIIRGGGGDDTLVGGTGNDILTGGLGADTFLVLPDSVFRSSNPSGATLEVDTISDFVAGVDVIDLSPIDSGDADGAFNLVGNFNRTAGQMTLKFAGGVTTLSLDVDGDAKADYQLKINGDVTGATGNWIL